MDGIRSEETRGITKAGEIATKVMMLKWCGHAMRTEEECVVVMDVKGRRKKTESGDGWIALRTT